MNLPTLDFDNKFLSNYHGLVGVDEVGRGALAGPVVAASALVPQAFYQHSFLQEEGALIKDSKLLSAEKREEAYDLIQGWVAHNELRVSCAQASVDEIESLNILGATRLAMERAINQLKETNFNMHADLIWGDGCRGDLFSEHDKSQTLLILVDGKPLKPFAYSHEGIIGGDAKSFAIGVASIVAKVVRDQMMRTLSNEWPDFGFEKNKGYGTAVHRKVLLTNGPSRVHRPSFLRKIIPKADPVALDTNTGLLC